MLQYWKQPYGSSSGALKSGDTPVIDGLRSENGDEDAIDMIAFAQVMDKLEDVVRKNIRSPRYVGVLKQLVNEELTVSEIAQNEGVSRNRAASILADLRKCLREARKRGDLDGII
jgi:DNA-directed RNA polymerase sigma subunit (sigma70/sigma32)